MLYKLVLRFESVDEILKCDYSNESYCTNLGFHFPSKWKLKRMRQILSEAFSKKGFVIIRHCVIRT